MQSSEGKGGAGKRGQNPFTGHGSYNIPQMLQMVNLHVADALPDDSYPLKKWNGCNHMFFAFCALCKAKTNVIFQFDIFSFGKQRCQLSFRV